MELTNLFDSNPIIIKGLTINPDTSPKKKHRISDLMVDVVHGLRTLGEVQVISSWGYDHMKFESMLQKYHVNLWAAYYYYLCSTPNVTDAADARNRWVTVLIKQHEHINKHPMEFMQKYPSHAVYTAHLAVKINSVGLQYAELLVELIRSGIVISDGTVTDAENACKIVKQELESDFAWLNKCLGLLTE